MSKLRRRYGAMQLAEAPAGRKYEVLRVYEKEPEFLAFLAGLKLLPGAHVRVLKREYDETMTVTLGSSARKIYLGKPATSRIWVRNAGDSRKLTAES